MNDAWTNRWDERYAAEEYAYGETPNEFLKEQLEKLTPGTILFPAEGEGRNGVYAATKGWKVSAFDISEEGKNKALKLAEKYKVSLDYQTGILEDLSYADEQFDVIALIYAHFPADIKSTYHQALSRYLKKGGTIIFEAFSKKHLEYNMVNPKVGGPKDEASLFSIEEIEQDFDQFEYTVLMETEIELSEGVYHNGTGSVIRFVGTKK